MKVNNSPPALSYDEKLLIKKAKTFLCKGADNCIIVTDNGVWWYCSDPAGAKEYLITNGAVEIPYSENY